MKFVKLFLELLSYKPKVDDAKNYLEQNQMEHAL